MHTVTTIIKSLRLRKIREITGMFTGFPRVLFSTTAGFNRLIILLNRNSFCRDSQKETNAQNRDGPFENSQRFEILAQAVLVLFCPLPARETPTQTGRQTDVSTAGVFFWRLF